MSKPRLELENLSAHRRLAQTRAALDSRRAASGEKYTTHAIDSQPSIDSLDKVAALSSQQASITLTPEKSEPSIDELNTAITGVLPSTNGSVQSRSVSIQAHQRFSQTNAHSHVVTCGMWSSLPLP